MRLKFLAAASLFFPALVAAQPAEPVPEVVVVTQASGPATSPVLPSKGMTKSSVIANYGQPSEKRPTVGGGSPRQPPITRWDYEGYSVIFENSHVVDTVVHSQPAPIAVYDGLQGGPQ
jgi:hypothetical protein